MRPTYFATPAGFRAWLQEHHQTAGEFVVGFRKKASGKPSITWPEAADQALCFGWIDGVRHSIDEERYCIRFTPRKSGSTWSRVNVARFRKLKADGLVTPAGMKAFEAGRERRLATLIADSAAGRKVNPLEPPRKKTAKGRFNETTAES